VYWGYGIIFVFNEIENKCQELSNMENLNSVFIIEELQQRERLIKLNKIAIWQMSVLHEVEGRKILR